MNRLARLLVFLLPLAASVGPMVRLGPLAVARVVALGMIALAVLAVRRSGRVSRLVLWMLLVLLGWLAWGFVTLRGGAGSKELFSVFVGFGSCIGIVALAGDTRGDGPASTMDWLRTATRGWLLAWFVVTLPVLWELQTGRHLPNYLEGAALWIRQSSKDVASYMVNPNLLAFFLVSAMAMSIIGWRMERGFLRAGHIVCILSAPVLCWFTNSRLILLFIPPMLVWWALQLDWVHRLRRVWAVGVGFGVLALPLLVLPMTFGEPSRKEGSMAQRAALYDNGWYMVWRSLGFGVGAGRFEVEVAEGKAPFDILGGPKNPHSGFYEIVSQYGILVGVVALGLLLSALLVTRGALRRHPDRRLAAVRSGALMVAVVAMPLSFANSTWLDSSVSFAQLAGLALAAHVLAVNREEPLPEWSHEARPRPFPPLLGRHVALSGVGNLTRGPHEPTGRRDNLSGATQYAAEAK